MGGEVAENQEKQRWEENPNAPHIVFDMTVSATVINGAMQVSLGAQSITRDKNGRAAIVSKPVAHLRMTPFAAHELQKALKHCFELAAELQKTAQDPVKVKALN